MALRLTRETGWSERASHLPMTRWHRRREDRLQGEVEGSRESPGDGCPPLHESHSQSDAAEALRMMTCGGAICLAG